MNKSIALVAHDNKKKELIEWSKLHRASMEKFDIYATGTTGRLLEQELKLPIRMLHSGPLGGDQQIGAMISEGKIEALVFFWDPMEPLPHDQDIKALLRIATVWNIPIACNRSTADLIFSTPDLLYGYERVRPDFSQYENRPL
ncbi:MAG TPA: methylglyoxal synthase [Ohtaekwangia sp.]|uniref:methylglyoxal synthase n=1 Tax=Ohtaekwangia sp. TaxID=2066019 RepID=UPI002F92A3BB